MDKILDNIYYINLDYRSDRKEQIELELSKMGLVGNRFPGTVYSDPIVSADPRANSGLIGCHISHLNLLKLAKEKNLSNIVILEDDFEFIVNKEELIFQIESFEQMNISYDVLFLSYRIIESEIYNDIISRTTSAQTASGYIVNNKFYDALIDNLEKNLEKHIETRESWQYCNDQCWKQLQKQYNFFYFNKRIGQQRMSYSDIEKTIVNYGV